MSWSISLPTPLPQPGEQICITITGGTGAEPVVMVKFDGDQSQEIRDVKPIGGGAYVACFTLPPGYLTGRVSVSGGRSGAVTAAL